MYLRYLWLSVVLLGMGVVRGQLPPGWWADPVREDSVNVYQTGSHTRASSPGEAESGAVANALDQFTLRLVSDRDTPRFPEVRAALRGWTLHAKHEVSSGSGHTAWVILRLPKVEMDRLSLWLSQGDEWFAEVRQCIEKGNYADGMTLLKRILDTYPPGGQRVYDSEPALLMLAGAFEAKGRHKEAMDRYQHLARTTRQAERRRLAVEGFNRSREKYNPLDDALSVFAGKSFRVHGEWRGGGDIHLKDLRQALRSVSLVEALEGSAPQLDISAEVEIGTPVERNTYGLVLYQASGRTEVSIFHEGLLLFRGTIPFSVSSRSSDYRGLQLAASQEIASQILLILQENKP